MSEKRNIAYAHFTTIELGLFDITWYKLDQKDGLVSVSGTNCSISGF